MPIYEFHCDKCGGEFDEIRNMGDDQPAICPACSRPNHSVLARKVLSLPGIMKIAGAPPQGWKPLAKSKPKSYIQRATRSER